MRSIRMRLMVVFSGVILLVCLVLGSIATVLISDRLMDNSFADLQELAQSEAKYVTSVVNSQLQYLDGIASHPYIADDKVPWDQKSNYLQQEASRVGYKHFVFANLSGQGEEATRNGKSVNVSSDEFFKQASSGKSVVSDVLINPVTGEAEIIYAVPLKIAGRTSGVLYAIQDAYILTDIVNQTNYRSTGYAYVINNDGTTVAHSNFDLVLQQDNDQENVKTDPAVLDLANLTRDYIMKRISGIGEYTYNGSHRMVGYAPIEDTPWILITGVHANEVKREVNAPRNLLIGIVIFSTFFGGIATFILSGSIAKPVQSLTPVLDKISGLDLRLDESLQALRHIDRKDEIGEVLRSLRTMESDLAHIIGEVQEAAESMATTGENLSAAAEENSATIEEVASSAGAFSQNVDQLHERAEAMGTSANAIDQLALEGQKKMNASMDAMSRIRSGSEEVEGSLQGLAQQTQNMERVLNLISEIADQTNLLALNAAIEAARAGDHGRGFAVVAEEVRNLAEQTQNSIVEITQMIGDLVRNATRSAQVMAETNKEVQSGTDLLNQTQEGLANITNKVMETNLLIREMSESVGEMQQGSANIAAATEEQAASMEEIASSTQSMANVGDGLREIVARFKI